MWCSIFCTSGATSFSLAADGSLAAQENLGHATAAFTLDVYGHVTERMKQESAARMENFMKRLKNLKG